MIFSQGMKKETSSEPVWPDSSKQCCQNINIVESGWLIKIKMFVKLGDHYLVFPYSQCDQIWLFWKYLENKFTQKVVQTFGNFLCFLKVKTAEATVWATFLIQQLVTLNVTLQWTLDQRWDWLLQSFTVAKLLNHFQWFHVQSKKERRANSTQCDQLLDKNTQSCLKCIHNILNLYDASFSLWSSTCYMRQCSLFS